MLSEILFCWFFYAFVQNLLDFLANNSILLLGLLLCLQIQLTNEAGVWLLLLYIHGTILFFLFKLAIRNYLRLDLILVSSEILSLLVFSKSTNDCFMAIPDFLHIHFLIVFIEIVNRICYITLIIPILRRFVWIVDDYCSGSSYFPLLKPFCCFEAFSVYFVLSLL